MNQSSLYGREMAAIQRCHSTFVCSDFEQRLLKQVDPTIDSYLVTFFYDDERIAELVRQAESQKLGRRKNFVWIGNFMHRPNYESCKLLVTDLWPKIRKEFPESILPELHIYGSNFPKDIQDISSHDSSIRCKVGGLD